MARARARAKETRRDAIRVRVTPEEKAAFEAAASEESLTVSSWIRSVAKRWLRRPRWTGWAGEDARADRATAMRRSSKIP